MFSLQEKRIVDMLTFKTGNIVDRRKWENGKIDAIVNAAKPTLMGSDQGVDGAIHAVMDSLLGGKGEFNKAICKELMTDFGNTSARCKRGSAVTTKGHGFCNYIIHVVGTQYDGKINKNGTSSKWKECTSSCMKTLELCYFSIIEEVKKHTDIETVGIPIIGAGEYKVPFEVAAEIAITSTANALVKWKSQDKEMFEMAGIRKIVFFIYDFDKNKCKENYECACDILQKYRSILEKDKKVVAHTSFQAMLRYWQEIIQNDQKRGYFAIARLVRVLLMTIRFLFLPILWIKDMIAGRDWEKRRKVVEWVTLIKAIVPLFGCVLLEYTEFFEQIPFAKNICVCVVLYFMVDTITYLMMLILMADIQNPSANLIRSIILLFVNYVEASGALSFLCYCQYKGTVSLDQALAFGFLSEKFDEISNYALDGLNTGVKFFFITLVFGYFMGHMRQRKFVS